MSRRMRRKEFLVESSRAALGFSLLPLVARAQGNQKSAELKNSAPSETVIADFEKLIPKLMEEAIVPGLSIAIYQRREIVLAAKVWRQRQRFERTC